MADIATETSPKGRNDDDTRGDLEQAVEVRKDAVKRGEGGTEPDSFTAPGPPDGVGGTGGVVKDQNGDAQ